MADSKRQSVGGKTQSQQSGGSPTAMIPTEEALSKAIGGRIRVTTAAPNASTLEGTLFTACPITNLVAINTSNQSSSPTSAQQAGDFHIIPISRIQSFQLISLAPSSSDGVSFTTASPSIHALDTRALKSREAAAITKVLEGETRRGKGVTREAQDIFDAFSRTMPARWDGTSIVIADAVVISKPYRVDDCKALVAGDSAALTRVRKVLEMERKKIELRNASTTIGNTNHFTRNAAQNKDRVAVPGRLDSPTPRKGG
ncbi:anticodon-binding domain-containing protein [Talaromyces proteolyticus]|uniref:Anticodon-binding domain-containing protein n=1 Tax=Talaromyces proteolyticus TaxID=1131652 RepID=A0AAD4KP21_9EURO|nr:anticodon-binding domain-containing protein [Talaromyces proteolyticus]KAH8696249.1 anticodon-binding domain-containing protein [Talaromyces proteolyticus]